MYVTFTFSRLPIGEKTWGTLIGTRVMRTNSFIQFLISELRSCLTDIVYSVSVPPRRNLTGFSAYILSKTFVPIRIVLYAFPKGWPKKRRFVEWLPNELRSCIRISPCLEGIALLNLA